MKGTICESLDHLVMTDMTDESISFVRGPLWPAWARNRLEKTVFEGLFLPAMTGVMERQGDEIETPEPRRGVA